MTWEAFVLLALASFRLTRLVTVDDVAAALRRWLSGLTDHEHAEWERYLERLERDEGVVNAWRAQTHPDLADDPPRLPGAQWRWRIGVLLRCAWCAGAWIGAAVAVAYTAWADTTWWLAPPLAAALSATTGLVTRHLDPKGT